jgi:hypothetical protein
MPNLALATVEGGESGFSAGDWVSILLASAAFVVSVASLYYAALRRPSLDVDVISKNLSPGSFDARGMPIDDSAQVKIYLANSGAAGTFVKDVSAPDFEYHGDGPRLWSDLDEKGPHADFGVGRETVLERADARHGPVDVYLARSDEVSTPEDVARRAAKLRGIDVTVRWTFRRPRLLRPWLPELKARDVRVHFEGATYRNNCVAEWRETEETRHLADIAEGRERAS